MTAVLEDRAQRSTRAALVPLQSRLFATGGDLLLVLPLVVTTLNSQGALSFIASPLTKAVSASLALVAAVILLVEGRAKPPAPAFWTIVGVLAVLITATSVLRELPVQRYLLLGQYLAQLIALVVWVSVRPQRVLGILYTASLLHLVLAVVFNTYVPWEGGGVRLGGGSHPLVLGFEASVVIVISLVCLIRRGGSALERGVHVVILPFAVYVLLQAFARQSLIAECIALVVLTFVVPGPWRWVRAYLAVALTLGVFLWLGADGIASLLGAERASDLSSATGRTEIWSRILQLLPQYATFGYGYYALNDPNGPDGSVVFASHGAPAENALLQITLDTGIAGAIIWTLMLAVGVFTIVRARGASRMVGLALLPAFLSSITVASGLAGEGVQWWWFLAVVAEAAYSARVLRPVELLPDTG